MHLIICTGDNYNYTKIALEYNYKIGAQLPLTVYTKLYFADQDWKRPDRAKYMHGLAIYRPVMATVLDLEKEEQYKEVLSWAEEASKYVEKSIVIIPKYNGVIKKLPKIINGKQIILGFSVPTKYGGTTVPIEEFKGHPVHLLGGNPHQQFIYYKKLSEEVVSADCNFHLKMANMNCQFFTDIPLYHAKNIDWPTIFEADSVKWIGNGRFEAFRRSCENILKFWRFHGIRVTV